MLTTAAALAIAFFTLMMFSRFSMPSMLGHRIFETLAIFGMFYALLAGPLTTVDSLSRERREGTLGLLFLTDLRSHDVVLGKMGAASLDVVLGLLALLPIVALPMLIGGTNWFQVALVAVALFDILFLSLALGVCASALCLSGRIALVTTLLSLLILTLGMPLIGEDVLEIRMNSKLGVWCYMFCPVYAMQHSLDGRSGLSGLKAFGFWLNLGAMHALAWTLLLVACARTRHSWRELADSPRAARWRERFERWRKGSDSWQQAWRRAMLDRSPIKWLEGRHLLEGKILWGLISGSAITCAVMSLIGPKWWPDNDMVILGPMWAHYVLCLWVAIQAPRRLAEDRQSGALELLLCTATGPREIVSGQMLSLRRRFGRALMGLIVLYAFLVFADVSRHGSGWENFFGSLMGRLAVWGALVILFQVWSFARVGLYQGLAQGNSLRATFMLVWKLGVLPWVLFMAWVLILEVGNRQFGIRWGIGRDGIIRSWAMVHLLVCGIFVAHASWHLERNFRMLVAQSVPVGWWRRWLRRIALPN
jgi:ABC-type transport system involved in cytochrome c biogenesis permease component